MRDHKKKTRVVAAVVDREKLDYKENLNTRAWILYARF